MTDFEYLKQLEVKKDQTVDYTLYQIAGEPTLTLASATEANKPYYNALLRQTTHVAQRMRSNNLDVQVMADNREADRERFAKYIVKGWSGIVDSKGRAVPFNEKNCLDFLAALPGWIFDAVRNFASTPTNYTEQVDGEEAAKN